MRRNQLTITYPEDDAQQLHQALLLLKRSRCLNISAFCREAIAEKLERLEAVKCEVGAFYWTVLAPDIVNPGREEWVSIQS